MAYNDDAVLAKLSALNETQESIVTVAQWVMFHRRHADRTGQLLLQRLKESNSNKRLLLIYLVNEVAQQSKARKKDDFLVAFSPIIAEATATAYKGAAHDVQDKLRRVVDVWRERRVFEIPIQDAIEARLNDLDKNKATKKPGLGSKSLFSKSSSSVPAELTPLVGPQQTITRLSATKDAQIATANTEYEKVTDPNVAQPSAPVLAARLNGVLTSLTNAENAVAESIKQRTLLIAGLEKLLNSNRAALAAEQEQHAQLFSRKTEIDVKKRGVEDLIMKGFATTSSNPATPRDSIEENSGTPQRKDGSPANMETNVDRPEVEALTPPPFERLSVTPPDAGQGLQQLQDYSMNNNHGSGGFEKENGPTPAEIAMQSMSSHAHSTSPPTVGHDLLASLKRTTMYDGSAEVRDGSAKKKQRLGSFGDEIDLGGAMDGIDDDVQEMLKDA